MTPLFSILHTSARPDKWRAVYEDWMSKCTRPETVEYVLCIDPRWGFSLDTDEWAKTADELAAKFGVDNLHVVINTMRRCYVDGVNIAAKASVGQILIVNADDQFAEEEWDEALIRGLYIVESAEEWAAVGQRPFVVSVSTGNPTEHERRIMVMPILSRARYEQMGFVFFPEYESMYADNDFCEHAEQDGIVIDARHLLFPHRHPICDKTIPLDEPYVQQNRPEAFYQGDRILQKRRAAGFVVRRTRTIALCLSGERFEGPWVDALLMIHGHLIDLGFDICRVRAATSNVYVTRESIRRAVMQAEPKPELCLWLDDDNPLRPDQFDRLLADLDAHPEVDGIAGWCWIHDDQKRSFMPSCGLWAPDRLHWNPFPSTFANESEPKPFEVGGLPVMLMRATTFEKAGEGCFLPILSNDLEHGMTGEDISFFRNAEDGGAKFLVDPQVRVPHLKYVEVEPVFPSEGRAPVKVACMMRVKNEGRWIARTIASVRELCGTDIYVMDDGSTDDTREIARGLGAVVLPSPFAGLPLNECRDKDWLLAFVKEACSPDWILMPDGDEELEPGGCEKILRALEANPPADCFALRFLYFWDGFDQARFDGGYGTMLRQSLFRANSNLAFRSYYEGTSNHVGLHCSNAPGLGTIRVAPLNVFLLHYGYVFREDRIRKYRWQQSIDPENEIEGFYHHMVQGDIPEVPPDIKLKHAGPLDLRKIPARLVPHFEVPPRPLGSGGESYARTNRAVEGRMDAEHQPVG